VSGWPSLLCSHCDRPAGIVTPRPMCATHHRFWLRHGTVERAYGPPPPGRWVADAACRGTGPQKWFPDRADAVAALRVICADCPVQQPCLEYALDHHITGGIWGGTTEKQRRVIRRERRGAA
jgi:WhiB family transcriptional regulator, redox-sensing transcriptional regulator